jgi:hypothetical protein
MNNLSFDGWFLCYKGYGYANLPLKDIHARINNKAMIDTRLAKESRKR